MQVPSANDLLGVVRVAILRASRENFSWCCSQRVTIDSGSHRLGERAPRFSLCAGNSATMATQKYAMLPSVGTWMLYPCRGRHGQLDSNLHQPREFQKKSILASLVSNPSLEMAASEGSILENNLSTTWGQQPKNTAGATCDIEFDDAASVASTSALSKASRTNLRRDKRKAALRVCSAQTTSKASSSTDSAPPPRSDIVLESGNEIAIQCNLGDDWQLKYDNLKAKYDEMESVVLALSVELSAVKRMAGFANSDDESDSESSLRQRIETCEAWSDEDSF